MQEEKDYFDLLLDDTPVARRQEDLHEELTKTLEGWQRAHSETPIKKDLFPSYHREAWVKLFIKYNSPLPSSAAVARMFSSAGDILRAKRSSLTASNFEELVFMRGNMELPGFREEEDQEMEQEEDKKGLKESPQTTLTYVNSQVPDKKSVMMYVMCLFQALPHDAFSMDTLDTSLGLEAASLSPQGLGVAADMKGRPLSTVSIGLGGYQRTLEEVLTWLLGAEDRLAAMPPIADSTDDVKEQFHDLEVGGCFFSFLFLKDIFSVHVMYFALFLS
ncbi:Utrophin [Chionoecetes opilio]|uniref:Utrophin n=1 Tax=Chionoecetes opilio TaxID=41210 RepID=A0A8J4YAD7_CHIOP|nr:Utrophin [Chionoecetes opilio]